MEPTNKPPVRGELVSRPEPSPAALEKAQKARGNGKTVIEFLPDADEIERSPLPRTARITVHALVAAFVTFILWASFSQVDRVVTARGKLVTPSANIVVQPLETSIIQKINVQVGQVVKKGDPLATLDPTFTNADQAQLRTRLRSLDNQSRGLENEISGSRVQATGAADSDSKLQANISAERQANYKAQLAKMSENVERLHASLATNRSDQVNLSTRLKSLLEIESMQEKLFNQQYSSRAAFLGAQEKRLEVERELQQVRNRENELARELAAADADRSAFQKGWRQKMMEDLLATSRDRDSVNEQLQKADKRYKMITLVAPADAVILEIAKLSEGSIVREAEALFTLVPLGSTLEAEVQIDSVDVGYIKLGDKVHVKLDAFPFQKHGTLDGKIRTISEDSFHRETAAGGGLDAYYLSRIGWGDSRLRKMNERMRLLPGMTVSAEIVVGTRSVMSYLLWPLTKAMDESIREP
jgi:HlyD family secretion protein